MTVYSRPAALLIGLALGFSGSAPAFAAGRERAADCAASVRNKPTLDARRLPSARFRMVTDPIGWERGPSGEQVRLTLRHGEETAELGSGVKLRVVQGGCETYSNIYEFSLPKTPDLGSDGSLWLRKASDLLRAIIPHNMDTLIPMAQLADTLAELANDPNEAGEAVSGGGLEGQLSASDLSPTYTFTVERGKGQRLIRVGYFIPL